MLADCGLERETRSRPAVVSTPGWRTRPHICSSGAENKPSMWPAKWVSPRAGPASPRGTVLQRVLTSPSPDHGDRRCQKGPLRSGSRTPLFTGGKLRPERAGEENERSHSAEPSGAGPRAILQAHDPNGRGFSGSISQSGTLTQPSREEQIPARDHLAVTPELSREQQQSEGRPGFRISELCSRPVHRAPLGVPMPKAKQPPGSQAALSPRPVSSSRSPRKARAQPAAQRPSRPPRHQHPRTEGKPPDTARGQGGHGNHASSAAQ